MRIPTRDRIATVLVACAVVIYVLWATGLTLPGMHGIRVTGLLVLALGFAASASAVVPGFDELLHGSRLYLAVTSLIGLVAFVGGLVMLVGASEFALGVTVAAMIVLWVIATVHHTVLAKAGPSVYQAPTTPSHRRPAGVS
ncbi:MAG: hypothetical protein ACXVH5_00685 [Ilumatobacteraceae bacterium]